VQSTIPHEECWWGVHLFSLGFEPVGDEPKSVTHIASATPDLRLPSQLQDITAVRLVRNCTAWLTEAHVCEQLAEGRYQESNSQPLESQVKLLRSQTIY